MPRMPESLVTVLRTYLDFYVHTRQTDPGSRAGNALACEDNGPSSISSSSGGIPVLTSGSLLLMQSLTIGIRQYLKLSLNGIRPKRELGTPYHYAQICEGHTPKTVRVNGLPLMFLTSDRQKKKKKTVSVNGLPLLFLTSGKDLKKKKTLSVNSLPLLI